MIIPLPEVRSLTYEVHGGKSDGVKLISGPDPDGMLGYPEMVLTLGPDTYQFDRTLGKHGGYRLLKLSPQRPRRRRRRGDSGH